MTMKFSKKLFIVVAVTFLSIVSSFLFMQSPSIASANTEPSFTVTGAQVRESDPAGIRFVTNVPKTAYSDSLKFGTFIIPTEIYNAKQAELQTSLTVENYASFNALNIETTNWHIGPQDTEDTGDVYVYYSTLVGRYEEANGNYLGLGEEYYDIPLTAISYYWDGVDASTAVYTQAVERSLLQVASTLLADPSYSGDKTFLTQIVDACTESTLSFAEGTEYTCKGVENLTLTVQGNNGLPVAWASTNTSVATVENGVVTGVGLGSTTITATLGSKVASFVVTFENPATTATDLELVPIRNMYDTAGISNYSYNSATYVEEFEGKQGLIKVDVTNWGGFYFKALQDASVYEGADYVVIRMYVTVNGGVFWINNAAACLTSTVAGEWVDYKFNASDVNFSGNNCITPNSISGDWSMYIDEIWALKATDATGNEIVPIRNELDTIGIINYASTSVSYVESFQGANGVIKVEEVAVEDDWGGFDIYPQQSASAYEGANYIVIKLWAEIPLRSFWFNEATQAPFVYTDITKTNSWSYFVLKASEVDLSTKFRITYNFSATGSIYIDEIYASVALPTLAIPNEVVIEDFSNSSSTTLFTNVSSAEHIAEYQGATGVVKATVAQSGGQCYYKFSTTAVTKEDVAYGDWDYLEIVFYTPYANNWLYCAGVTLNIKSVAGWNTIRVQKSQMTDIINVAKQFTGTGCNLLYTWDGSTPLTEVYFDSIKVVKNA